jgi:hypothetical protein
MGVPADVGTAHARGKGRFFEARNANRVPDEEHRRAFLAIDPSDLALEIVSIVIAIVLATAVGQVVSNYQAGARSHEALEQVRQEVVHDDAALRKLQPLHRHVRIAFDATIRRTHKERLDYDGFARTFADAAPHGFHPFSGTTTAWELARSSSALAESPYALRAALETRYAELEQLGDLNSAILTRLTTTPTDDHPNFFFTAGALLLNLTDVVASEDRLLRDDDIALRALAASGIR